MSKSRKRKNVVNPCSIEDEPGSAKPQSLEKKLFEDGDRIMFNYVRNVISSIGVLKQHYRNKHALSLRYPFLIHHKNKASLDGLEITKRRTEAKERMIVCLFQLLFLQQDETQIRRVLSTWEHTVQLGTHFDEDTEHNQVITATMLADLNDLIRTRPVFFNGLSAHLSAKDQHALFDWLCERLKSVNYRHDDQEIERKDVKKEDKKYDIDNFAWDNINKDIQKILRGQTSDVPISGNKKTYRNLCDSFITAFKAYERSIKQYDRLIKQNDCSKLAVTASNYYNIDSLAEKLQASDTDKDWKHYKRWLESLFKKAGLIHKDNPKPLVRKDCLKYFRMLAKKLSHLGQDAQFELFQQFISGLECQIKGKGKSKDKPLFPKHLSPQGFVEAYLSQCTLTLNGTEQKNLRDAILAAGLLLVTKQEATVLTLIFNRQISETGRLNRDTIKELISYYRRTDLIPDGMMSLRQGLRKAGYKNYRQLQLLLHAQQVHYFQPDHILLPEKPKSRQIGRFTMFRISEEVLKQRECELKEGSIELACDMSDAISAGKIKLYDGQTLDDKIRAQLTESDYLGEAAIQPIIRLFSQSGIIQPNRDFLDLALSLVEQWQQELAKIGKIKQYDEPYNLNKLRVNLQKLSQGFFNLPDYQPIQRVIACSQIAHGYYYHDEIEFYAKFFVRLGWYGVKNDHFDLFVQAMGQFLTYMSRHNPLQTAYLKNHNKKWEKQCRQLIGLLFGFPDAFSADGLSNRINTLAVASNHPPLFQPLDDYMEHVKFDDHLKQAISTYLLNQGLIFIRTENWVTLKTLMNAWNGTVETKESLLISADSSSRDDTCATSQEAGDDNRFKIEDNQDINLFLQGKLTKLPKKGYVSAHEAAQRISAFVADSIAEVFVRHQLLKIESDWVEALCDKLNEKDQELTMDDILESVQEHIEKRDEIAAHHAKTNQSDKRRSVSLKALRLPINSAVIVRKLPSPRPHSDRGRMQKSPSFRNAATSFLPHSKSASGKSTTPSERTDTLSSPRPK